MIIVIDGPAGSGKSSTAKAVADKLDIQYLDSGALYRTLTLIYLESGKDKTKFFELLNQKSISFYYTDGAFNVSIGKQNITDHLRTVEVSEHVSTVAAMLKSREHVNRLMRKAVQQGAWIAEGRDLGTAVFPDAELKFFMVADLDTRAERRYKELKAKGTDITKDEVKKRILERDRKDSQRKSDPLRKADDAIKVDTSEMTFEQQVNFICSKITDKFQRLLKY
ncbi:(d)CMP kinase [Aliifodinibius sp. S!AR15-10]|uniref:(d)CMP kinase n=1 Tax=Aliifodinibius sp. S!AR15-10 TaxID=2950437 RepID=UPI00285896D6|nr:(d)CMP kinase [Aliifodinibius sp. S!AR15-10]MDR8390579.1 (d)CMP kinase [Aliifodinibius sp. S!AR15-10]